MPAVGVRQQRERWRAVARLDTSKLLGVEAFSGLDRGEVGVEAAEGRVPGASEALDPIGRLAQRGGLQVAGPPLARPRPRDESGYLPSPLRTLNSLVKRNQ